MSICCLWKWNKVKVKSLSPVWLFATPWTVTYEAPPSMGFSRQECWVDCHFLLQGIFPTQELNPGLLHCRQTLYRLSHQGSRCLWPLYQIVTVNLPWHSLSFSSVNSIWLLAHQEYLFFFSDIVFFNSRISINSLSYFSAEIFYLYTHFEYTVFTSY